MLKLIVGVKGSGKTKALVEMANAAAANTNGSVVCVELGNKLSYDLVPEIRLIDTEEYGVKNGQALYGFVCGIIASNHDITDVFMDGGLKICNGSTAAFNEALHQIAYFVEANNINCVITASMPVEELDEGLKQYII